MPKNDILEGLNPKQKEAVLHEGGPLLVIAGAGTGKTTVIARRIAHLIISKKAKPEEVLALTFTDKAAAKMEEEVDILLPYGFADIWISTFHAFGDMALKENALEMGIDPDFKVLTTPQQIIFFREHLFEFPIKHYRPLSNPTRYIEAMVKHFSRAKDEDVSPDEYIEFAKKLQENAAKAKDGLELTENAQRQMEVALTYKKYQELMEKHGKIDFGNQVFLALQLFREHKSVLKQYQERFRYILVDEFQDTNFSQFQLVKLLAARYKNEKIVIGFDLLNEPIPHYYENKEDLNKLLEPFYKKVTSAIRSIDKNHIIFLGGAQWNTNFKVFSTPFDKNLAYTFHKYWMPTEQKEIQEYVDYSNKYNVPIYMGESGENDDVWIDSFRKLLDNNEIGWCFWPYKKMDSTRGIVSFVQTEEWKQIIKYAETPKKNFEEVRKAKPMREVVRKAFGDLLENIKFKNYSINKEYLKALGL